MGFFINNPNSTAGSNTTQKIDYTIDYFTATEDQKVFNLSKEYAMDKNRVEVFVGNVPQFGNFIETNSATITLETGVKVGSDVVIKYF